MTAGRPRDGDVTRISVHAFWILLLPADDTG